MTGVEVDEAAVVRACDGDRSVRLSAAERRLAVGRLLARGWSQGQVAVVLGVSARTVERDAARLREGGGLPC